MSEVWIAVAEAGAVGQAVEAADDEVDQVRRRDAGELGHVDVGDADAIAPIAKDRGRFPT